MGMFDKDKEIGVIISEYFALREEFIVWSARITREDFPTKFGLQPQAEFEVSRPSNPGDRIKVTTLASAITTKVKEADASDFPALCMLNKAPSKMNGGDALVINFLKPWGNAPAGSVDTNTGEVNA